MRKVAWRYAAVGIPLLLGGAAPPDVYLLMGQSNMSGRGALEQLTPAERVADPRVTLYANDGTVRPALDPLDADPEHANPVSYDAAAGVGPGLFFARHMVAATGRAVELVPCAKGGTGIGEWQPGDAKGLLGSCVARAQAAGGRLAGALWYQGESDTRHADQAGRWPASFTIMTDALRRALGRPNLPILFVRIGDPPPAGAEGDAYPAWRLMQRQQRDYRGRCMAAVNAAGLPRNADGLHLATAGQRRLGRRLGEAMRRLKRRPGCGG